MVGQGSLVGHLGGLDDADDEDVVPAVDEPGRGTASQRRLPSSRGRPRSELQRTPANFSPPFLAKQRAMSAWSWLSTLTPNRLTARTRASSREARSRLTTIIGGLTDKDMKALTVVPWGPPGVVVVTTTTVLLTRAMDSLKSVTKASAETSDMLILGEIGVISRDSMLARALDARLSAGCAALSDIRSEAVAELFEVAARVGHVAAGNGEDACEVA